MARALAMRSRAHHPAVLVVTVSRRLREPEWRWRPHRPRRWPRPSETHGDSQRASWISSRLILLMHVHGPSTTGAHCTSLAKVVHVPINAEIAGSLRKRHNTEITGQTEITQRWADRQR